MPRYRYYGPAKKLIVGEESYHPGDELELTPRQAKTLLRHKRHHLVEVVEEPESEPLIDSPDAEADEALEGTS